MFIFFQPTRTYRPLGPMRRIHERDSHYVHGAPEERENVYVYFVKNPEFWSDFLKFGIGFGTPLGSI